MSRLSRARWLLLATLVVLAALAAWLARATLFAGREAPVAAEAFNRSGPREIVKGVEGMRQPRATPEDERIDPAALRAAADYAAAHEASALLVSRHGHIVFEQYWQGASADAAIDAGAFGATVAAMMVGVALYDRRIGSIDEPATNYITEWGTGPRRAVTIRQLLEDPGEAQSLVTLVERAAGKRYASYVSRRLWKPLAAGDATLVLDREGGMPHASCCFHARASDWMRIGQLLMADGHYQGTRILPDGWAAQMISPAAQHPDTGYHVRLGILRDGLHLAGEGASRLWLVPRLQLAVLSLGKEPSKWDESRIAKLVLSGVQDLQPVSPEKTDLSILVPNH